MKKTISINISGIVFYIEEAGYNLLKQYLDNIRSQFSDQEEAEMVIEDVELRVAELFTIILGESKTAITTMDVEAVIAQMGDASEYAYEEEEDKAETKTRVEYRDAPKKKLYRDPENGNFAGVATGLAQYFNVDPAVMKVIFILFTFFFGPGLLIYIVLWIVLPKVDSTTDRLKMKGRPITVDNITKEVNEAGERISSSSKKFAKSISESADNTVSKVARVISKLIGIGFIAFAIFWLVSFLVFTVGQFGIVGSNDQNEILSLFDLSDLVLNSGTSTFWAWFGIYTVALSVICAFILFGLMLLLQVKSKSTKRASLFLFFTFFIGCIICIIIGGRTGLDFVEDEYQETEVLTLDTTSIQLNWAEFGTTAREYSGELKREDIIQITDSTISLPIERIKIYPSKDSLTHIYTRFGAHGNTSSAAIKRIDNMDFEVTEKNGTLEVPSSFTFPYSDRIRNQSAEVIIELPENTTIFRESNGEVIPYKILKGERPIRIYRIENRNYDYRDFD